MRLALVLTLASSGVAIAKPCPPMGYAAKVLTPMDATIATGGGIVVGAHASSSTTPTPDDPAAQTGWRVRAGSQLISPGIKVIAPGLDVYDVGDVSGVLVLEDTDQKELLQVRRGKVAVLDAPKLKRVFTNDSARKGALRRSYVTVTAVLVAKAPSNALALVVYGKDGVARSWGTVYKDATTITLYSSAGCSGPVTGTMPSAIGDMVRLAWVDSAGRVSKLSPAISVAYR